MNRKWASSVLLLLSLAPLRADEAAKAPDSSRSDVPAPPQVPALIRPLLSESPTALVPVLSLAVKAGVGDEARLALGYAQALSAAEKFLQDLHRYGFFIENWLLQMVAPVSTRSFIPENTAADDLSYEQLRGLFETLYGKLSEVDETLAGITDPAVRLPVPVGSIRLDINSDGKLEYYEGLGYLVGNRTRRAEPLFPEDALLVLDRADVEWLRGYCRLVRAACDLLLAYDFQELFDRTGHMFFEHAKTRYPFLLERPRNRHNKAHSITDLLAYVSLLRLKLIEPERVQRAHQHLLAALGHSRAMWRLILAETDDDYEWIPSPKQQSGLNGWRLSQAQVDAWMTFLQECEDLLEGRKLVPFWRNDPRGVNLARAFKEPRDLDVWGWLQGPAAVDYLQDGPQSEAATWTQLQSAFRGQLVSYAFWIN